MMSTQTRSGGHGDRMRRRGNWVQSICVGAWIPLVMAAGLVHAGTLSYTGLDPGDEASLTVLSPKIVPGHEVMVCSRSYGPDPKWCATLSSEGTLCNDTTWYNAPRCNIPPACAAALGGLPGRAPGDTSPWYITGRMMHVMRTPSATTDYKWVSWEVDLDDRVDVLAGPNTDLESAELYMGNWITGEKRGTIHRIAHFSGTGPQAPAQIAGGMCRARVDPQGKVIYQPYSKIYEEKWTAWDAGCVVRVQNLTLKVGPGENAAAEAPGTVRCTTGGTVGVTAYGMAPDRSIAFDHVGLRGTITVQGKDATTTPVVTTVKPGQAHDLGLKVHVSAAGGTSGGKSTGSVVVVVAPA